MRWRFDLLTAYGLGFLVFLYAPVLLLPLFSFNDNTFAVFPLVGFTFQAYIDLSHNDSLLHALRRNVDIKVLLFNNEVHALSKGQFSPTKLGSEKRSKPDS